MEHNIPPAHPTPPAEVRRITETLHEHYAKLSALESRQGADFLSTKHDIGIMAGAIGALMRQVEALNAKVDRLAAHWGIT